MSKNPPQEAEAQIFLSPFVGPIEAANEEEAREKIKTLFPRDETETDEAPQTHTNTKSKNGIEAQDTDTEGENKQSADAEQEPTPEINSKTQEINQ